MAVWCMNSKDKREKKEQNQDEELKFRLCMEKSMITIGWGVDDPIDSWYEYRKKADQYYGQNRAYKTAVNNLQRIQKTDFVWIKHPIKREYYLAQVIDDTPSICTSLRKFDFYGCRKVTIYKAGLTDLTGDLEPKHLVARHVLEQMHADTRGKTIDATIKLFKSGKLKKIGG